MVNLNSIPTTNTLNIRISLLRNGLIVESLDPGEAKTLTINFNEVMLVNPGHQPQVRNQNPNVAVTVHPGNIAYFRTNPAGVVLNYAQPGQNENTINFT